MTLPSIHVEPTNRCTLSCPRCARTILNEKFGKGKNLFVKDIDVNDYENFIDIDLDHILFCGTHGDPIYHNDFINLIKVSKQKAKYVRIVTNGSYRSSTWWQQLVELLDQQDEIVFSIDGTPDNFTKYRINGDWNSIKTGIKICTNSDVRVGWKYIVFSFNEQCIDDARLLSEQLGIDKFEIEVSDRWIENDWLKPIKKFTSRTRLGTREDTQTRFKQNNISNIDIDPLCTSNEDHYINSLGYYLPCCYVGDFRFYYKSFWWKNKDQYSIKDSKLSEQIKNFNAFYKTINVDRPNYCLYNCGKCYE